MPLNCFACFGGGDKKVDAPFVSPIEEKRADNTAIEAQRRDDAFLQELQAALSGAPTDSAEARISQIAALVLRHLHARAVRLYGWSTDDTEEGASGHLVLLAVDWKRGGGPPGVAGGPNGGSNKPPLPPVELPDLPGQRIAIPAKSMAAASPPAAAAACTSLLQQAVHSKTPAVFSGPQRPAGAATGAALPPDCAGDAACLGASAFAALPLTNGDRLLGVLWLSAASAAATPGSPYDGLPPPPVLRQVASCVAMCLLGGIDPEYLAWLTGSLRRLAAAATLQALVGELCDATAQHVRRRFLVDAVAHAAVVPEPRSTVAFMLDHRPQPGGPGGVARWAAAAAARQASMSYTGPPQLMGGPGGGGPGGAPRGPAIVSGASIRRSDSFTSQMGPPGPGSRPPGVQQRSSAHAPMRPYASNSKRSLMEQAAARSAAAAAAATGGGFATSAASANTAGSATSMGPNPDVSRLGTASVACVSGMGGRMTPGGHACKAAAAAAAVASGVVPSLRAKGFQLSHTLLQRMIAAAEGRGPDGVYSGLAVADCGRHVQDVHQPSRDVCMLMAGGVRGADMTADASDSNIFASERSTGRIAMQSLVLIGVDVGQVGQQHGGQADAASSGAGGGGGGGGGGAAAGAVLALYLAFPTRLPPLLVSSAHTSCRQMLSVMLSRLVRSKVATDLEAEFQTLCSGVPGSYAVVPSTPPNLPPGGRPDPHATAGTPPSAAGAGNGHHATAASLGGPGAIPNAGVAGFAQSPLDASGLRPVAGMVLEPSIGTVTRASSCKLVPLNGVASLVGGVPGPGMSLGASAQLLAAFTDAGCRPSLTQGSVGRLDTPPRPGLPAPEASGRVFPQTHDGSARTHGGSAVQPPGNVISLCQDRGLFESTAEAEEEEEDASPTHEEGDVMLSSDPRAEGEEDDEDVDRATAARTTARRSAASTAAVGARRTGSTAAAYSSAIREQEDDDIFPSNLPDYPAIAPRVPATPAAVLTVSEADGTSSMRQHMGLLVESLMSTLRSTAQMDEPHFDSAIVSARRSMDLELEDLRLSGVLGDGGSGVVLCGMLGTVPVAVKIIQMPEVDQLLLATTVKALGQQEPPAVGPAGGGKQAPPQPATPTHGSPGRGKGGSAGGAPPRQSASQQGQGQGQSPQGQGQGQGGQVAPYDGAAPPGGRVSVSSSKLKQARRDMLRNAMELAVMRSISHVNITTVYAVYDNVILERVKRDGGSTAYALRRQGPEDMTLDKTGSKPVFVALCMELCDSGSLASKLEERSFPRLLVREEEPGRPGRGSRVLDMVGIYLTVLEVACALRYLHARRLLHRDIKSANILLRSSPTDPRGWTCKLADFGSAIVLDQFQPPEDMSVGSPGEEGFLGLGPGEGGAGSGRWFAIQEQSWGTITHMSPESMDNNSRVDASSDIFALGIVMWEIASGRGYRPYKELAPEQIGAAVRRGLRPTFTAEVPVPYRVLAQQCWAAEPHKRPSAVQVVAQIKAQLSQLQSEARHQQHHQQQHHQQHQQQHFGHQSPAVARSPHPA
ncbi:hypothetical protein PLESTB_000673900 [Pleodorina starrii]|uniref:Protein kinase domain-containing protein n=1 Tax=Pleodorina starrii TaxID=330485 RepID=A0A9W6BK06_9CHLO|nr:hypothetical protein PLESTB_000673900 [Pleodorina starrii]GLC65820.1 hypothetical protein PLESTF_000346700 [Pleodorina starrii]